ncbi:DNA-directed RNA polymerase subunit omega [Bacillus sp. FJAT-49732]|uniref:DNA-directed RNA polymerase subunit omega n=1 Tax=Lederbergia citrisecunda TaxID=2833583 RepID=A0A942YJS2_9BACI|nr:DNA-directed RNA polymerase subunit omega [Lederbergia citrisecunda]MBS4198902.1 DNA-directed RNA polymerase subunit omega [Lederbergia citrisecunda]
MLYPSIDKLMTVIDSKYSLVTIASRRARNLQDEENPRLNHYRSHKYVGKALEEIYGGVLKLQASNEDNE